MWNQSEEESTDLPCTKLHNLPEAIACLEDGQFLECSGYTCESTETTVDREIFVSLNFRVKMFRVTKFSLVQLPTKIY